MRTLKGGQTMTTPATVSDAVAPLATGTFPPLHEAEEEAVGESSPHYWTNVILAMGLVTHLASRPQCRVFADLNLYFPPGPRGDSVTPDVMVVTAARELGVRVSSYRLPADGPAPLLVVEVLSENTARTRDLGSKVPLYAE